VVKGLPQKDSYRSNEFGFPTIKVSANSPGDLIELLITTASIGTSGLGALQHQRAHVGQDKTQVEGAGTVDVADVAVRIQKEDTQRVIHRAGRALWLVWGLGGGYRPPYCMIITRAFEIGPQLIFLSLP